MPEIHNVLVSLCPDAFSKNPFPLTLWIFWLRMTASTPLLLLLQLIWQKDESIDSLYRQGTFYNVLILLCPDILSKNPFPLTLWIFWLRLTVSTPLLLLLQLIWQKDESIDSLYRKGTFYDHYDESQGYF